VVRLTIKGAATVTSIYTTRRPVNSARNCARPGCGNRLPAESPRLRFCGTKGCDRLRNGEHKRLSREKAAGEGFFYLPDRVFPAVNMSGEMVEVRPKMKAEWVADNPSFTVVSDVGKAVSLTPEHRGLGKDSDILLLDEAATLLINDRENGRVEHIIKRVEKRRRELLTFLVEGSKSLGLVKAKDIDTPNVVSRSDLSV
jgi:hypothetical protein